MLALPSISLALPDRRLPNPCSGAALTFEALTGAQIEVTTVPFAELYNAILTDQTTGTNSYDAFVMSPQWNADFVAAGILEDLTERVNNDPDIQWDDITPFFRNFIATYNGSIYVIPLDGDFHMVYYRTDVFEEAIDGVNYAPFAAFGGWGGGVSGGADDQVKEAAYAFFSYLNQPAQSNVDVTIGASGYNPYRLSQFENLDAWIEAGFSETAARNYLGAIEGSLGSENMVLDLSIPGTNRYLQATLDTVVSQYLAGEFTAEEAAQEIFNQWNEISNELGREAQHQAYLASLGISTTE